MTGMESDIQKTANTECVYKECAVIQFAGYNKLFKGKFRHDLEASLKVLAAGCVGAAVVPVCLDCVQMMVRLKGLLRSHPLLIF